MGVLNINVGILGHVDSGKTSLVRALSTVISTAALDKHPQSQERGITLDLGFSAFTVEAPDHFSKDEYSHIQFTLVDCPGHASLIRTIIGGAQIMDMMILVVDVTKGLQAQTLECIVIAEAVMERGSDVIVVLNKVDLIPMEERPAKLRQAQADIQAQLANTWLSSASYVCCAAAMGSGKAVASASKVPSKSKGRNGQSRDRRVSRGCVPDQTTRDAMNRLEGKPWVADHTQGDSEQSFVSTPLAPDLHSHDDETFRVEAVVAELTRRAKLPSRRTSAPLYFAFDHCFQVRGQGTVLTGTVLTGEVKVNQLVEIPILRAQKKIKSMQMFRKAVSVARAGDRVGICVSNLDAKLLERGVVTSPGSVRPVMSAIALVRKVPAFRGQCRSGASFHVSLGHATAMATATFFGAKELREAASSQGHADIQGTASEGGTMGEWPLPLVMPANSAVLGSRLDTAPSSRITKPVHGEGALRMSEAGDGRCRIAFQGRLIPAGVSGSGNTLDSARKNDDFGAGAGQIKMYKDKVKTAVVFRLGAGSKSAHQAGGTIEVIGKDLFKKETDMMPFMGMIITTESGSSGVIESAFGTGGKFKVRFPPTARVKIGDKLMLKFRKYAKDESKRMDQRYLREAIEGRQPIQEHMAKREPTVNTASSMGTGGRLKPSDTRESPVHVRDGVVASVKDEYCGDIARRVAIITGLFSQEEDIRAIAKVGLVVHTLASVKGALRGPFGKLGKCKVDFSLGDSIQEGESVFVLR